jgi:putative ABC transport system ATP-binding protein
MTALAAATQVANPIPVVSAPAAAPRLPGGTGAAVACRGIVKDFDAGGGVQRVLHGIDLDLPPGELALLVGPSGCGKTTLISIVAGILGATEGEVRIHGEAITAMSDRDRTRFRRRALGFIFQQYNLLPALTAAENAAIPLIADGVPAARAERRAGEILDRLGMAPHRSKLPRQLSGGQQQRIAIARALVHEPRLVVCDEPTAALDAEAGRAVMDMLRRVAVQPGRGVVVVTHDNRVFGFADRIVSMEDGRVTGVETRAPAPSAAA